MSRSSRHPSRTGPGSKSQGPESYIQGDKSTNSGFEDSLINMDILYLFKNSKNNCEDVLHVHVHMVQYILLVCSDIFIGPTNLI